MADVQFLSLNDVLLIHQSTIEHEGGAHGVRDITLVESAVAAPMASFGGDYLHPDLGSMAAAYMFSLINNHGFIDGNKRLGTLAAMVFLDNNGVLTLPDPQELEAAAMGTARGEMNKADLVSWWRQRLPG